MYFAHCIGAFMKMLQIHILFVHMIEMFGDV